MKDVLSIHLSIGMLNQNKNLFQFWLCPLLISNSPWNIHIAGNVILVVL